MTSKSLWSSAGKIPSTPYDFSGLKVHFCSPNSRFWAYLFCFSKIFRFPHSVCYWGVTQLLFSAIGWHLAKWDSKSRCTPLFLILGGYYLILGYSLGEPACFCSLFDSFTKFPEVILIYVSGHIAVRRKCVCVIQAVPGLFHPVEEFSKLCSYLSLSRKSGFICGNEDYIEVFHHCLQFKLDLDITTHIQVSHVIAQVPYIGMPFCSPWIPYYFFYYRFALNIESDYLSDTGDTLQFRTSLFMRVFSVVMSCTCCLVVAMKVDIFPAFLLDFFCISDALWVINFEMDGRFWSMDTDLKWGSTKLKLSIDYRDIQGMVYRLLDICSELCITANIKRKGKFDTPCILVNIDQSFTLSKIIP